MSFFFNHWRIFLIVSALVSLVGCATLTAPWTAPEVELLGAQPRLLGLAGQSFLVNLQVKNPNDRTLPIKALSYRVLVEGHQLAEGDTALERLIPPGGLERVDLEVRTNLLTLLPELPQRLLTQDRLDWTVSGIAYAELGGVRVPLPYRRSGQLEPKALIAGAGRGPIDDPRRR